MNDISRENIRNATIIGNQIFNDLKNVFRSVSAISNAEEKGASKTITIKRLQDLDDQISSIPSIPKIKL